jgi:hypothetical protein
MYKMTKEEIAAWASYCDKHNWAIRFYTGMKYSDIHKRYHPIHRFDILWEEYLDLYGVPDEV